MIVCPERPRCERPYFVQCVEQVMAQPVVADGSIVALDVGVLLRLAGLDVLDVDLPTPS